MYRGKYFFLPKVVFWMQLIFYIDGINEKCACMCVCPPVSPFLNFHLFRFKRLVSHESPRSVSMYSVWLYFLPFEYRGHVPLDIIVNSTSEGECFWRWNKTLHWDWTMTCIPQWTIWMSKKDKFYGKESSSWYRKLMIFYPSLLLFSS